MKYRFSVEFDLPEQMGNERAERFLRYILEEGAVIFGHTVDTFPFQIDKLRARSVDLEKPVGEQE